MDPFLRKRIKKMARELGLFGRALARRIGKQVPGYGEMEVTKEGKLDTNPAGDFLRKVIELAVPGQQTRRRR